MDERGSGSRTAARTGPSFATVRVARTLQRWQTRAQGGGVDDGSGGLVAHAMAQEGLAMLQAHFWGNAIAAPYGIPGGKDRRTALRHQLIHVQAGVTEEMAVFSEPIDLQESAEEVERVVGDAGLFDMLFLVARPGRSTAARFPSGGSRVGEPRLLRIATPCFIGATHHSVVSRSTNRNRKGEKQ